MLKRKSEGCSQEEEKKVKSHVREIIMCLDVKSNVAVLVQLLWDQDRESSRGKYKVLA